VDALKGFCLVNHRIIIWHAILFAIDAVLAEAMKIAPNDPQAVHEGVVGHSLDDPHVAVYKVPMPSLEISWLVAVASRNSRYHTLQTVSRVQIRL
jgi:hypothetical protein